MTRIYSKFPGNWQTTSFLILILIVINAPGGHTEICSDIDIRNHPKFFKLLENCTVISGSLRILLIERHREFNFSRLSFPKLREISGYLMLFRVHGLKSLVRLFPNLTVIRGQTYISHYSLIIFEMTDLEEIGLKSLVQIQSGYVFIGSSPNLCYADTINWDLLTVPSIGHGNLIRSNVNKVCPSKQSCGDCTIGCWNSKHCQLPAMGYSFDGYPRCHSECLGNCINNTVSGCLTCKNWQYYDICFESCPYDTYTLEKTRQCLSATECRSHNRIPFQAKCRNVCPSGYDPDINDATCIPCTDCRTPDCTWRTIESLSVISEFYKCQTYHGDLVIQLSTGAPNTMALLIHNLAHLRTINGSLKIHRSPGITSLEFLDQLHTITGSSQYPGNFSLIITENENLQTLWNLDDGKKINITSGNILIAYNSNLCLSEIHQFQNAIEPRENNDIIDVYSNGFAHSCKSIAITARAEVLSNQLASVQWFPFTVPDTQRVDAYYVFYIEASEKTVNYTISDTCNKVSWQSDVVTTGAQNSTNSSFTLELKGLTPYTQYAYYVSARVVNKINEQFVMNVTQGLSDIAYFTTFASVPTAPKVETVSKNSSSITLKWYPQVPDRELITYYIVDIFIQPDEHELLDNRNYCLHPREEELVQNRKVKHKELEWSSQCNETKYLADLSRISFNQTEKEKLLHEKKVKCLLLRERNVYETMMKSYLENQANNQCAPNDEPCEEEYNSWRFKRELDSMFKRPDYETFDEHISAISESSILRKRSILESVYLIGSKTFSSDQQTGIISGLQPFTLYTMHFFSCNNITNCSSYYMHNERSGIEPSADDVTFDITTDKIELNTIHVDFREPKVPNGLTVAFVIEHHDLPKHIVTEKCITSKDHAQHDFRYTITNATIGTHSFRLRSISLAQNGTYSQYQYHNIVANQKSPNYLIMSLALIGIFFAPIYTFYYLLLRRNHRVSGSDEDILLPTLPREPIILAPVSARQFAEAEDEHSL